MEDDGMAGWEQQDDNERRRWEEEQALTHCRAITEQSRRDTAAFEREMRDGWKRILNLSNH
jgi:hypothetical protein